MIDKETILFHSNILSKDDVPFINEISGYLKKRGLTLILTGWNPILPEWNLDVLYYKLPEQLNFFENIYNEKEIKLEFKKYNISTTFLLDRFNWWFAKPKDQKEELTRLSFLHFHLHHYLKLIKKYNPSLLLVWNGNDPRQYIIDKLGKNFNIKTLFIERGPLPSVIFYDTLGVLSNSSISSIDLVKFKGGFNNYQNFEEYKEWYFNTTETLWSQPNKPKSISLREQFGIDKSQKITLFIGQVDNDIQTKLFSPYFTSNIEAFKWFVNHAIEDNHFVVGKHHPKSLVSVKDYESVIVDKPNVIWTDQFPLDECLEVADYIVTVNSSVIFDALLKEKPVFSLGTSLLSNKDILYEFSPVEFEKVLKDFYSFYNFNRKLEDFKNMLELLFRENLVFIKKKLNGEIFTQKLIEFKERNDNFNNIFEHRNIVDNYFSNVSLKQQNNFHKITFKKRFKKEIKWYFTKIFSKK